MSPEPAAEPREAARPLPGAEPAHPLLDRAMRLRRRAREFDRRHPQVLDAVVAAAVALVALSDFLFGDGGAPGADGFPAFAPYAFTAAMALALWWRRRHPAAVFFVLSTIVFAQSVIGVWLPSRVSVLFAVCTLLAFYTLASVGSLRLFAWGAALIAVELALMVLVLEDIDQPLLSLLLILGTVTAAGALGLTARVHRMYTAALEERARRLEIERDQRERLIAAAERSRIAREMHDILGHNLSVMVTLADGAATLAGRRGEESAGALRMLGDTGREAMDELRRVLGVLHADERDPRSLSPQPGVDDLEALFERVRAAGLIVTCRTSGRLGRLGSGVQLTVYRIIQEALTNTLKHAGGPAAAAVTLAVDDDQVHIRVVDTGGDAAPVGAGRRETGRGLIGIRERAALYGGTATIGPNGSGWVVDVLLERTAAPHGKGDSST
ncbi:MAG TPA: sensor histidine kinase [Glycomyces sp.]